MDRLPSWALASIPSAYRTSKYTKSEPYWLIQIPQGRSRSEVFLDWKRGINELVVSRFLLSQFQGPVHLSHFKWCGNLSKKSRPRSSICQTILSCRGWVDWDLAKPLATNQCLFPRGQSLRYWLREWEIQATCWHTAQPWRLLPLTEATSLGSN